MCLGCGVHELLDERQEDCTAEAKKEGVEML